MKKQFITTFLVFTLFTILNLKATHAVPGVISVCNSGCNYSTLQSAANASTGDTKIVITGNLSGAAATLNAATITQNLNIECAAGVELNASGAPVLLQGSAMTRSLKLTGCTLKGATSYLVDMSTSKTITLSKNKFYDTPVRTNTNTSGIHDSNAFINSRLLQGLGYASITNNTFSSTAGNTTAIRLAPTGNPDVMHNTINGYAVAIEFFTPKNYVVYNNLISNTTQAFLISNGAMVDTYNTLLYFVDVIRNLASQGNGNDYAIVTGNPYFIDDSLHIHSLFSAAKDSGDSTKTLKYDKDGIVRSDGMPDIGAYEVIPGSAHQ